MAKRKAVLFRLDPKVYEALRRWANDDLRSVNAQAEFVLRMVLRDAGRLGKPDDPADAAPTPPGV